MGGLRCLRLLGACLGEMPAATVVDVTFPPPIRF